MDHPVSKSAVGLSEVPTLSTLVRPSTAKTTLTPLRVYVALGLGIVCIALSAIFTRDAGVPGTVSAFYRVGIAVLVLAIPLGREAARGKVATNRRIWLLAAGAGVFFAIDLGLWNTALFHTSAANATLLANDAPIVVGLGSLVIFHARLKLPYWIGLVLGLAGMGIIVGGDIFTGSGSRLGLGDVLALVAGVAYAGYLLTMQRVRADMETLPSLWIPGAAGALMLLVFNLAAHQPLWGFSSHAYLALIELGIISQVIGWLAINYALGHLPAAIVSATLLAQPVLTAIIAVPLLGEAMGPQQMLGGVVALSGIYLVNRGFARRK
jgi:drug/metabolite transporter (DMT)-like permease